MNFDLSDDQRAFNDQIDRFLHETCPVDLLHKAFDGDQTLSRSIWRGMLDLGLGGLVIPEAHGGLGLGLLEAASVSERIGYGGAPGPWIGHILAGLAIAKAGSPAQVERWLPRLASGEAVGAVALMEGEAWAPHGWTLDGSASLNGAKDYVMGLEEADVFVVGLKGGALALVEASTPGLQRSVWASTDRTRPVGQLGLGGVAAEPMPTIWGEALVNAGLILAAADAHGAALRMVEDIVDYSKTRIQFGRPIGGFQAVKHKLADLALLTTPNGPLYRQAAADFDEDPNAAALNASTAKAHITETSCNVARVATESYGGIGYTWEHSAHIWLRRTLFDYAWLGGPLAHRERAAQLTGW